MATSNWNTFKDVHSFVPTEYGGLQDLGLYINFHDSGLGAYNNNAIYKVGDSYYLVASGDPNKKLNNAHDVINLMAFYDNRDTRNFAGYRYNLPNGIVKQITDPDLIAEIEAKGSTTRNVREELGKFNGKTIDYNIQPEQTQETKQSTTTKSGGGGGYNPYAAVIQQQNKTIADMQKKLDEANRVYSGDELAEHYGIKDTLYSRDYWNKLYTDYVNEMYDNLINQQTEYRDRYTRNNSTYDDYLEKEYMDSYNNASNARATRGAIAANALSTGNVNDYNSSRNDINMLQNIYGLEALRQAGLADVANKAEQAAVNTRKTLMELGAKHNTSDVLDITNGLNAAATVYGADKNYLSGVANAARAKYGGLVNAAGSSANSNIQQYYDWYMQMFNNNKDLASTYLTNTLGVDSKVGV